MNATKKRLLGGVNILEGAITPSIISFTAPLVLAAVLQTLYHAADIMVVGNFAGKSAVVAVGATTSITNLLLTGIMNIAVGTNILLSRAFGAKDKKGIREIIDTTFIFALCLGVAILVLGEVLATPLLKITGCPDDVMPGALTYMGIYLLCVPATVFYNYMSTVLRVNGDTVRPFIYLTVSGLANVVFNLFFVLVLKITVAGVAIATVISSYLSAALLFIRLLRVDEDLRLRLRGLTFSFDVLKKIIRYGVPSAISASTFSITNVQIQSAINSFGQIGISGNTAAQTIEGVLYNFTGSFNVAASTFVGQCIGAGNRERAIKVQKHAYALSVGSSIVISAIMLIFGEFLLGMFIPGEVEAIEFGMIRSRFIMSVAFFNAASAVSGGVLQAYGYTTFQMLTNLGITCGFRVIWMLFIYPLLPTPEMLYICYPITWIGAALILLCAVLRLNKRYKRGEEFRL